MGYWLRVNGSLFQNVSNYFPDNSGWSQVTPQHFDSVLVKKTKSPSPFGVITFILKMVQFSEKINKKNYQKLPLVTLVTLVTKVLTLPLLGRRDSQRRDDIE